GTGCRGVGGSSALAGASAEDGGRADAVTYMPDVCDSSGSLGSMRTHSERLLWIVLLLNLALVTGLVVVGLTAHSIGVLAAGVDYLADSAAVGVSLLAIRLAHPKATTVAALVNAGWLLALNLGVLVAATHRLTTGAPRVHGLPVLIASTIAALVMGG